MKWEVLKGFQLSYFVKGLPWLLLRRLKGEAGRLLKTHLDKAMMLQGKTRRDIKAIDFTASPTDISPAEDIDPDAGASENGSGPSGSAQPAHPWPGFLSLSTLGAPRRPVLTRVLMPISDSYLG